MLYANACNTDHANDKTHLVQITTRTMVGTKVRSLAVVPILVSI